MPSEWVESLMNKRIEDICIAICQTLYLIAMVPVLIHNKHTRHSPRCDHMLGSNGNIIEVAKPLCIVHIASDVFCRMVSGRSNQG